MATESLMALLARMKADEDFKYELIYNFDEVAMRFDLSSEELDALRARDSRGLELSDDERSQFNQVMHYVTC